MADDLVSTIKRLLKNVCLFTEHASGLKLRNYQKEVAQAIVDSVIQHSGFTFVVMFPRQSGKNELQAQIESYLLTLFSQTDAEIVKVSPTWKPQSLNAMRRLDRVLTRNLLTRAYWSKESGYIRKIGRARIYFLSGEPTANIVGATASTLLEVDEAQDVLIAKFDKDVLPMAASTNATRVFWGTAWTSTTLLARELRAAQEAEKRDGIQRVFIMTAAEVGAEVPAYKNFVAEQVQRLGRNHPMIKTQYFSEEIDSEGGMFPPARIALMQGAHPRAYGPTPGRMYAMLIDIAGEDEAADDGTDPEALANPKRDSTSLTIIEVDTSTINSPGIAAPTYRVINRQQWQGVKHTAIFGQLQSLVELWTPRYIVTDATGVGAGLTSFLSKSFPDRVIPFLFNSSTKSKLGWDFLAIVETGRFKDYADEIDPDKAIFRKQLEYCRMEIVPGPDKRMKWSVPDGTRDPETGEYLHDDLILSGALCSVLEELDLTPSTPAAILQAPDVLKDLDQGF